MRVVQRVGETKIHLKLIFLLGLARLQKSGKKSEKYALHCHAWFAHV